jgi:hypothetical protein
MLETNVNSCSLENNKRLCNEIGEILVVLTNAEKQGQNLYSPLKQIEVILNELQDEKLLILYQHLLNGFKDAITDEQIWADYYFTFLLRLCIIHDNTRTRINQVSVPDKSSSFLIPA